MKNKKILIVLLIIIFITVAIIIIFRIKNNYSKENIAIEYLNTKYGDSDWKIISKTQYVYKNTEELIFKKKYITDGVIFTISSSYIDGNYFHLYVNKNNMVTTDCFLPTYYSLKYNIEYEFDTDNFSKLIDKMGYIINYHYPYQDYSKENPCITSFYVQSFYDPISVQISPVKEKVLDIIPDNQCIPELEKIIQLFEDYYSYGRLKNENINDEEFYELVFKENTTEEEIINYILSHITPIDGMTPLREHQLKQWT